MAGIRSFNQFNEEKKHHEIVSVSSSYASYSASISSLAAESCIGDDFNTSVSNKKSVVGQEVSIDCSKLKEEAVSNVIDKDTFDRLQRFVFIYGLKHDAFSLEELQQHFRKKFDIQGVDVNNELERLGIVSLKYSEDRFTLLLVPRTEFMDNYEKRRLGIKVPTSDVNL